MAWVIDTGIPVPEGEPTRRECLTVRYGAECGPLATVSATGTARRPLGVKLCSSVVYVPTTDIFPKVNPVTY
jgi:hypothetical protein